MTTYGAVLLTFLTIYFKDEDNNWNIHFDFYNQIE